MCLAVPGQVVEWLEQSVPFSRASVEFAGVRRTVGMACVPEAEIGDYVLVHAGIAISRIDGAPAAESPAAGVLATAGFQRGYKGLVLRPRR